MNVVIVQDDVGARIDPIQNDEGASNNNAEEVRLTTQARELEVRPASLTLILILYLLPFIRLNGVPSDSFHVGIVALFQGRNDSLARKTSTPGHASRGAPLTSRMARIIP